MLNLISELSASEKEIFIRMSNHLNLDEKTKLQSLEMHHQYRELILENTIDFKSVLASCILISAKSQKIKTLDGKLIQGIGISMNQVIKTFQEMDEENPFNMKEYLFVLKDMLTRMKIDQETQVILKELIRRFVFIHLFHCKYIEIVNNFLFDEKIGEDGVIDKEFLNKLRDMGWIWYIVLQNCLFDKNSKEIGPNALLLLCVLLDMMSNIPQNYFRKVIYENETSKIPKLVELLCKEMKIKHMDLFMDFYDKKYKEKFEWFVNEGVIRSKNQDNKIFSKENINYNISRLDMYYQKTMGMDNIDERFFLTEKSLQTTTKFTPFTPVPRPNTYNISESNSMKSSNSISASVPPKQSLFSSNRSLNFDSNLTINTNFGTSLNEIKNDKNMMSPFLPNLNYHAFKNPMQTPMTQNLEMYNWWNECIKKIKPIKDQKMQIPYIDKYFDLFDKELKNQVFTLAEKIIKDALSDQSSENNQKIFFLYLRVLDEMIKTEERKLEIKSINSINYYEFIQNLDFHRSLVAISIETSFFIVNKVHDFQILLSYAQIEAFDFWKMITSFIKFDRNMPQSIKDHFLIVEKTIIFNYAWKSGSIVDKLVENFEQKSTEKNDNIFSKCLIRTEIFIHKAEELFFKKVIYYTAGMIMEICENLCLDERITENIWQATIYVLSSETRILINRDVNHLIICAIYAVCKSLGKKMNFEDIIQKYSLFPHIKDLPTFTRKIYLNENENGDIIKFYNEFYVPIIKTFILTLKKNNHSSFSPKLKPDKPQVPLTEFKKPIMPLFSIQSPLKETLNSPYQLNSRNLTFPVMTPLTKTLYAFGESLQSPHKNYIDFKEKMNQMMRSQKKINFDNKDWNNSLKNRKEINLDVKLNFKNNNNFGVKRKFEDVNQNSISDFNENTENIEIEGDSINQRKNITPDFKDFKKKKIN